MQRLWKRKLAETKAVAPKLPLRQQVVRQPQQGFDCFYICVLPYYYLVYIQRQVSQDGRPIQHRQYSNGQPVQYVYRSNQSSNIQQSPQSQRIYVQRPQQVQGQSLIKLELIIFVSKKDV